MIPNDIFESFEYFDDEVNVFTANGDSVQAIGRGIILVEAEVHGETHKVRLGYVWHVPSIRKIGKFVYPKLPSQKT